MTITQLLIDTAVLAGVVLFAVLAIVPLWLEHEAERTDRPARSTDPSHDHDPQVATVHPIGQRAGRPAAAPVRPRAA